MRHRIDWYEKLAESAVRQQHAQFAIAIVRKKTVSGRRIKDSPGIYGYAIIVENKYSRYIFYTNDNGRYRNKRKVKHEDRKSFKNAWQQKKD